MKNISRNELLYYIFQFFYNWEFHAGNWVFFYLIYMNYQQLGIFDTICFTFGMLMEIPTGALADKLGRKWSISLGMLLGVVGVMTLTFGGTFRLMMIGYLIISLGWAFYSGANEAFLFDALKKEKREDEFDDILSRSASIGMITLVIVSLLGAWLFTVDVRLPHFLWGAGYGIAFIVSLFFKENFSISKEKFSLSAYLTQYKQGFVRLLEPHIRAYLPLILIVQGLPFLFAVGLIRPALSSFQGFDQVAQSIIFAIAILLSAGSVLLVPLFRKKLSDFVGISILAVIVMFSFLLLGFKIGLFAVVFLLILEAMKSFAAPWISSIINEYVPSIDRATTLSTIAMITKLPYSVLALLAGYATNANNTPLVAWGLAFTTFILLVITYIIGNNLKALRND